MQVILNLILYPYRLLQREAEMKRQTNLLHREFCNRFEWYYVKDPTNNR